MTFKPLAIIEFFKDGIKVAEDDPTWYTEAELKVLLEIQEMQGRTWEYKILKEEDKP